MAERGETSSFICLSSDEEDETGSDGEDYDSSDDEESSYCSFSEEEEDDDSEENKIADDDDDESLCNRVVCLLQEGGNLEKLSLTACKAYLRKHGLRIAGTKAVCIQRIIEHWKIKDGNGEALNPRSSFFINCTGDVCKGDVVLFTQKVYEKFDKVTRHGGVIGSRSVAGRVVKESYGAAKQQHTFTVEVLWSKGTQRLPPLFPLLVKGRNLYKMRTFRQPWKNEAERRKVLDEKHRRGAAARLEKEMRKEKKQSYANVGPKHQEHLRHSRPLQKVKRTETEKAKRGNTIRKTSTQRQAAKPSTHHPLNSGARREHSKQSGRPRAYNSPYRHNSSYGPHLTEDMGHTNSSNAGPYQHPYHSQRQSHQSSMPASSYSYYVESTSTRGFNHQHHWDRNAGPHINPHHSQTQLRESGIPTRFPSYSMESTSTRGFNHHHHWNRNAGPHINPHHSQMQFHPSDIPTSFPSYSTESTSTRGFDHHHHWRRNDYS